MRSVPFWFGNSFSMHLTYAFDLCLWPMRDANQSYYQRKCACKMIANFQQKICDTEHSACRVVITVFGQQWWILCSHIILKAICPPLSIWWQKKTPAFISGKDISVIFLLKGVRLVGKRYSRLHSIWALIENIGILCVQRLHVLTAPSRDLHMVHSHSFIPDLTCTYTHRLQTVFLWFNWTIVQPATYNVVCRKSRAWIRRDLIAANTFPNEFNQFTDGISRIYSIDEEPFVSNHLTYNTKSLLPKKFDDSHYTTWRVTPFL